MENFRILAKEEYRENDTWRTQLNNNDLIIGPSGAGKTRYYVKPNVLQCNESMIIADTKGNLHHEVGTILQNEGYDILRVDFKDLQKSDGYNPLDFVRYDERKKQFYEQDVFAIAKALVPIEDPSQPFWEMAAQQYLCCLIAYVLEVTGEAERHFGVLPSLILELGGKGEAFLQRIQELATKKPNCLAVQQYALISSNMTAERMHASILGIVAEKITGLVFSDMQNLYVNPKRLEFKSMTTKKTAVFLCISDTDRSMDTLCNLFYTQALQNLCAIADESPKNRLIVPVRFILDDFATNTLIEGFDKIISVIRSREIYVSIILQSITQLYGLYGTYKGKTIINNCDNCLYLGGQDVETAEYISVKCNIPVYRVLEMPLDVAILFTRGSKGKKVQKYELKDHPRYAQLEEAKELAEKEENLKYIFRKKEQCDPLSEMDEETRALRRKQLIEERRAEKKAAEKGKQNDE